MNSQPDQDPIDKTYVLGTTVGADSNAELPVTGPTLLPGSRLGRFEIKRQLGAGGMGSVYLGFDPDLGREVAIKVLINEICGDPPALARFRSEAQAAGNLNHPNVVAVHEIGDNEGSPYIVMEYVTGGSVVDLLKKQSPLPLVDATRIFIHATRGIAAAHEKGLIHRDIKPGNLMIAADGTIKVADFGLARARNRLADADVTQEGQILGTPYFMSPEQCQGEGLDVRSDLYSLGATYYMLLTGVSPYQDAGSAMAILAAHINQVPPDPKRLNPLVPAPCVRIIHRLLAKSPEHRYPNANLLLIDANAMLKIVEDPESAKEVRYRGAVQIPREIFDLPSETEGVLSRKVETGGTVQHVEEPSAEKPKSRSWFSWGGRTQSEPTLQDTSPQAPTATPPVGTESDPNPPENSLAPQSRGAPPRDRGRRKEVYSGKHGRFVLSWPEDFSPEEAAEVRQWLEMIGNKLTRVANENHVCEEPTKPESPLIEEQ